ncbi:LysR family transcriptional regulator [Bordetella genomosp. 10]|uniref:LysR family transcriptional regulator n=1 Tax=Bordetella genomosp. 10 TaxID=1416804 RepID=A0A261SMA7_9BORD|nr:LysR family transcriptional regulator [Bordetella genomosp. 10]OZI37910.1 LysR family transcriptional regulator [Bordetella genomosp. 10]
MDTAWLRSFLLVVEAGSMAEAARRLDITPAAVAKQLRNLEREVGTPLLARSGRTVRPTDAGHRVTGIARSLQADLAQLKRSAFDGEMQGELRLGTISTALHSLVPDMLARLVKQHPQLRVFIQPGMSMDLYDAVQSEALDAAVCLHPQFALPKAFFWHTLREEPLVALVPQRLARRDPHDLLRREPLIRYDRRQWGGRQAEDYLRKAGIVPHERFELSSLAAIAMMVDRGLGVSLAPDAGSPWPGGLRLAKLALPVPMEPRLVGVLCLRSSSRLALVRRMVELAAASR